MKYLTRNDLITPNYRYSKFKCRQTWNNTIHKHSHVRRRSGGGRPYHSKLFGLYEALFKRNRTGRPFNQHEVKV